MLVAVIVFCGGMFAPYATVTYFTGMIGGWLLVAGYVLWAWKDWQRNHRFQVMVLVLFIFGLLALAVVNPVIMSSKVALQKIGNKRE